MTTKTYFRKNYKSRKHARKTVKNAKRKMQHGGVDASSLQKKRQQQQEQAEAHQTYLREIAPIQSTLTGDAKEIFDNMLNITITYRSNPKIQLKSNVSADHIVALRKLYDADKTINEQANKGFAKFFSKNSNNVKRARIDKETALEQLNIFRN